MKVLLDECVPAQVRHALAGHDVATVQQQGWTGFKNGELLAVAESAGFDVFILADKNLRYQQNLTGRRLGISIGRKSARFSAKSPPFYLSRATNGEG